MLLIPGILASKFTPQGDFESIQTVSLTGTQATIEFTSIPSTFQHLQIRYFARTTRTTYGTDTLVMRINNISTSSYSFHYIVGDGASAAAAGSSSQTNMSIGNNSLGTTVVNHFGVGVIDILDYKDTNKFKTIRALGGADINGVTAGYGGHVSLGSGLFQSTNAVSSIQITAGGGSYTQYSHMALYGIKG
jgi:hypothetical protein